MPRLAAWLIRCALAHLVAGAGLGAVGLAWTGGALPWRPAPAAHAALLLVGWSAQFALGVAYWIFPRHPAGRPHGAAAPAWAGLALLNAGTLALAAGAVAGGAAAALGALALGAGLWRRVRATGTATRG